MDNKRLPIVEQAKGRYVDWAERPKLGVSLDAQLALTRALASDPQARNLFVSSPAKFFEESRSTGELDVSAGRPGLFSSLNVNQVFPSRPLSNEEPLQAQVVNLTLAINGGVAVNGIAAVNFIVAVNALAITANFVATQTAGSGTDPSSASAAGDASCDGCGGDGGDDGGYGAPFEDVEPLVLSGCEGAL